MLVSHAKPTFRSQIINWFVFTCYLNPPPILPCVPKKPEKFWCIMVMFNMKLIPPHPILPSGLFPVFADSKWALKTWILFVQFWLFQRTGEEKTYMRGLVDLFFVVVANTFSTGNTRKRKEQLWCINVRCVLHVYGTTFLQKLRRLFIFDHSFNLYFVLLK